MLPNDVARYYVTHHPRDSARILEAARSADLKAFLDVLPLEEKAIVLGNLIAPTAASYLADLPSEPAAAIVDRMRSTTAAQILAVMTQAKRHPILDALRVEMQSTIRHLLRYPDDSVGALMLPKTLMCRVDATVRRAKQLVRRLADVDLPMMVVVDDTMRPEGLIAVGKLLTIRERELIKDHMRSIPVRLRAHADVHTVLHLPAWQGEDYLPVVEIGGRYVGMLPKARLHPYALAARGSGHDDDILTETVLNMADMVWGPAAEALARLAADQRGDAT